MISAQAKKPCSDWNSHSYITKTLHFICAIDFVHVYISVQAKNPTVMLMHAVIKKSSYFLCANAFVYISAQAKAPVVMVILAAILIKAQTLYVLTRSRVQMKYIANILLW